MLIQRPSYTEKLLQRVGTGRVKILNGPRKCGKTTILFRLFPQALRDTGVPDAQVMRINFNTVEARLLREPSRLIERVRVRVQEAERLILLLDEVHRVEQFIDVLYSLLQLDEIDIFLTDSQPGYLTRELLPELFGEGEEILVYPLTLSEEKLAAPERSPEEILEEMLYSGGMPGMLALKEEEQREEFCSALLHESGVRAMAAAKSIRKTEELEQLIRVLSRQVGTFLNPPRLREQMSRSAGKRVTEKTIKTYVDLMTEERLLYPVCRLDILGNRTIQTPLKYYFADMGLRRAAEPYAQVDEDMLIQNLLYLELIARGYIVNIGAVEFRPFDEEGHRLKLLQEVTFVARKGPKREYLQLVRAGATPEELQQAEEPMLRIKDSFPKRLLFPGRVREHYTEKGTLCQSVLAYLNGME